MCFSFNCDKIDGGDNPSLKWEYFRLVFHRQQLYQKRRWKKMRLIKSRQIHAFIVWNIMYYYFIICMLPIASSVAVHIPIQSHDWIEWEQFISFN